ncbi:MAG: DMP19 family protein [Comamonas sp.]|jgi:hypothetical protein|uniref:DMP19 family protein n=1 Tax=Comamonas sp. TaxID=34028 RepID=UPI00281B4794|nr:DUF4375 domain-containing protein [Comamonas sp.]MDR0214556.1 DMP19 family protein [Comamonas sp.]
MQRLPCTRCGDSIHPDTARQNAGLCMPCVRGNQLSIEERKARHQQQREEERAYYESPAYRYWTALVHRVYGTPDGFDTLSHGDRLFYLLNILQGEVHNGGFEQFFSNSSGDRYAQTVAALTEVEDHASLRLLQAAKLALFADHEVPTDQAARFDLMPTAAEDHPAHETTWQPLEALDAQFYADSSSLDAALDKVVNHYKLYTPA